MFTIWSDGLKLCPTYLHNSPNYYTLRQLQWKKLDNKLIHWQRGKPQSTKSRNAYVSRHNIDISYHKLKSAERLVFVQWGCILKFLQERDRGKCLMIFYTSVHLTINKQRRKIKTANMWIVVYNTDSVRC